MIIMKKIVYFWHKKKATKYQPTIRQKDQQTGRSADASSNRCEEASTNLCNFKNFMRLGIYLERSLVSHNMSVPNIVRLAVAMVALFFVFLFYRDKRVWFVSANATYFAAISKERFRKINEKNHQ